MIDLTKGPQRPHHHIRLTKDVKQDIALWFRSLDHFNGKSFFLDDKWLTSPNLDMYTDAAGSLGYGAIFGRQVQRANARRGRVRDANSREPSAGELVSNLDALLRSALSEGS
ncbi:hypothetical protein QZH41_008951, partial [Actinostola sp. cb2023]